MRRGELYRVYKGSPHDPRKFRVFVVASRQVLIESHFSTLICAPVYTAYEGLSTQVPVGVAEGLAHDSSIHCDELVSILKTRLTHFVGILSLTKTEALDHALAIAVGIPPVG